TVSVGVSAATSCARTQKIPRTARAIAEPSSRSLDGGSPPNFRFRAFSAIRHCLPPTLVRSGGHMTTIRTLHLARASLAFAVLFGCGGSGHSLGGTAEQQSGKGDETQPGTGGAPAMPAGSASATLKGGTPASSPRGAHAASTGGTAAMATSTGGSAQ